ncbi:MAG TPA: tRNA 4-thiouridine(8) synthase ThiI [Candidatus Ornithomonoglobus intestinigallinarum]|uniref:Probable tRNA sulfurtransferase n=1 Tax=Candidatus Ornithomonoglobus intestinigallinarum TaxID=2840894 RepID=A0A9D1KR48_9FIRM|nr:tRNA 4-thiouridine(8) synthase ThiI [Candidatus Ornithomonoglobus intestinigallinarum]
MKEILLAKYGEIILKGGNRHRFESILMNNIADATRNIAKIKARLIQATIYVDVLDEGKTDLVLERMTKIFGIVSVAKAAVCGKTIEEIEETAKEYLKNDLTDGKKFKVETKRADKSFPLTSQDISREVGGYLDDAFPGVTVDVHEPDVTVRVEVRELGAYVYCEENKIKGQGGMPIGTGSRATLLLSGGIDSPVAGHMIAKRGVEINAVNFFSFPYTSERAKEKVIELASIIARYTSKINLYIVPFTDIQLEIREHCPEEHMTLLMRRFMMRISERIARQTKSLALITGESVGQVASQTLSALDVTNAVIDMPVLQPLIGMDKIEVIERAREIGTYDTSILPYEDCCTVFTPKHPTVNPKRANIEKSESHLDVERLIDEAMAGVELIEVYPS